MISSMMNDFPFYGIGLGMSMNSIYIHSVQLMNKESINIIKLFMPFFHRTTKLPVSVLLP